MPRIITVDPTGSIARIVRSAMDLMELSIIQVDVPTGADGLEELGRPANLVVSSYQLDEDMRGFEFALRVKRAAPDTAVLILGDHDDPDELDDETMQDSPFVYLSRPVDIHQFLRVLLAGMDSQENMKEALHAPAVAGGGGSVSLDMGPVPDIKELTSVETITDNLLRDLGALGIIFATRTGDALIERGTIGELERDELTEAMIPMMMTNINVKELLGGEVTTIQFYDGDTYDLFVLSVGLHHLLCVMFDGQTGSKNFGAVTNFGRRAVQDLIGVIGANAFFLQAPIAVKEEPPKRRTKTVKKVEEDEPIELARAEIEPDPLPEPESVIEQLEPIENLDLDDLFGGDMEIDESLFDESNLEELAKNSQKDQSALDWDQAQQLGILGN